MPGDHNVSNALAAVAVARHLGMKKEEIRARFEEIWVVVNRRFTRVGEVNWCHDHRRLRAPPCRDCSRFAGRTSGHRGPRDCRASAAPL